jgi:hypothetical protein
VDLAARRRGKAEGGNVQSDEVIAGPVVAGNGKIRRDGIEIV